MKTQTLAAHVAWRWLLTVLLLVPAWAQAQGLAVTVKARGSGTPVAGATVVLGGGDYGETDAEGHVRFSVDEFPVPVRVLAPGYETLSVTLGQPGVHQVHLYPRAHELQGMEVVAQRVDEQASKVVLSARELQQAAGTAGDPINAIHTLPGVVASHRAGAMHMRGSGVHDNVVRVNGLPVQYLHHFGGWRSVINPALVSDFNVFLGGFPVEYGDRLGGAIDVRLRAPKRDRIHQTLTLGTLDSAFLVEGPIPGKPTDSFFVAGRRSLIDLLLSPSDLEDDDEDTDTITRLPRFWSIQSAWRRELSQGTFEVLYLAAGDGVALDIDRSQSDPQLSGELDYGTAFHTLGFNWQSRLGNSWSQETVVSLDVNQTNASFGVDDNGDPFRYKFEDYGVRGQSELRWQLSPTQRVNLGAELWHRVYPLDLNLVARQGSDQPDEDWSDAPKIRVDRDLRYSSAAPFIKHSWTLGKLTSHAGLRYSLIDGSAGTRMEGFSPRFGLEYQLTQAILLTANWGHYLQMPEPLDLAPGIGNPGLVFTEAEHRVLGVQLSLHPQWQLQLETYQKPLRQLVVGTSLEPPDNLVNQGRGLAYGSDLLLRHNGLDGRFGWLSYSYARTWRHNEATGERYDYQGDQPHTLNLVWGQPLWGAWHRWNGSLRLQATSGQPYTPVVGREEQTLADGRTRFKPIYGELNSKRLPHFVQLDMRFDRTFMFETWQLNAFVDIFNITNRSQISGFDYGKAYERVDNPRRVYGLGLMPFFGVEAKF